MTESRLPNWLLPLVAACTLLSAGSIFYRIRVEARNKSTEITAEMETIENLAASQGVSLDRALLSLKESGLGSVVLSELTVADLLNSRQAEMRLSPGATAKNPGDPGARVTFVLPDAGPASNVLRRRLSMGLQRRFPSLHLRTETVKESVDHLSVVLEGDLPNLFALRQVSIGLDATELAAAQRADLRIIGRFGNPLGATKAYVEGTLSQAKIDQAYAFLPSGDQVLGRRQSLVDMENSLRDNGLFYCSPEFAKLGGDANVVSEVPELVIRLHSAQSAELDKLPYPEAVDRYVRAARERNQRVLLLRPVSFAGPKPLEDFRLFVVDVYKGVLKQGGAIGAAKPFTRPDAQPVLFLLLGLAMVVPVGYTLASFLPWRPAQIAIYVLLTLAAIACISPHHRVYMAFAGAVAFPILAFLWLDENQRLPIVASYLGVTLLSFVGGMCVAGLLNDLPYYIHAEQFEGVKVAVFLPILAVGLHYVRRMGDLRAILKDPITYRQAILGLVILAALGFMISRTGNDNPAGVSGFELKMRDVLDKLLFVRPRTKEFAFGHPFLVLGLCLLAWERAWRSHERRAQELEVHWNTPDTEALAEHAALHRNSPLAGWTALALMLGAVGQTDVVNTLCHIHSPILLAFARIGVGWLAGGILGWVLWALVAKGLKVYGEQLG